MKIIAKQVDPEYQSSPFEYYEPEDYNRIVFIRNRSYNYIYGANTEIYDDVKQALVDGCLFDYLQTAGDDEFYATRREVIEDYFTRPEPFTDAEIDSITQLVYQFCAWNITVYKSEDQIIAGLLSIIDGHAWKTTTLRGCCQSDWIDIIYDADVWTDSALRWIEAAFFNTGSEFVITSVSDDGTEYDDGGVYLTEYFADAVKEKIAALYAVPVDDVELWYFDGYNRTPRYKIA